MHHNIFILTFLPETTFASVDIHHLRNLKVILDKEVAILRQQLEGHDQSISDQMQCLSSYLENLDALERRLEDTEVRVDDHENRLAELEKCRHEGKGRHLVYMSGVIQGMGWL